MSEENNDKFTHTEDGKHKAYYGHIAGLEGDGWYYQLIVTPYFKHKINCEEYTRKLCDVNKIHYSYEENIWAHYGKWTRANGEEIDEADIPRNDQVEKR